MQQYQKFWKGTFTTHSQTQLVVDWDDFIHNFSQIVAQHGSYQLNSIQKQYLKTQIDPLNTNQIYKNAFLLFAKKYWDIPSNRNNLFKMKMNLSRVLPQLDLLSHVTTASVIVTLTYKDTNNQLTRIKYQLNQDNLHSIDNQGFTVKQHSIKQSGFLSIGRQPHNDIVVDTCLYMNAQHLKIISVTSQLVVKKKSVYGQLVQEKTKQTLWYIKDVAKSNRIKYSLDSPYKYVIVKPGMVISFGLTEEWRLTVTKVGFDTGNIMIQAKRIKEVQTILNADRIDFLGDIDPKIPIKTVLDIDYQTTSPKQIDQLYQAGQYYPQPTKTTPSTTKDSPSLSFTVQNTRTTQQYHHTCYQSSFTVGRSGCSFNFNAITMRKRELSFGLVNGVWLVRDVQPLGCGLDLGVPGVYLCASGSLQGGMKANRLQLKEGYPYNLRAKHLQIEVELRQPKQVQQY